MKKSLLLCAAMLSMSAAAFAQNDITPSNYYFNNAESFSYGPEAYLGANLGNISPVWAGINGDEIWNNGLCVVGGGQFNNPDQPYFTDLKAGTQLVNLGGQVGQVWCLSGQNSKINEKLDELGYTDIPEIKNCTGGLNWFNLNWFTDPNNTPTVKDGYFRVRMVVNVYSNALPSETIFNKIYAVTDQGGVRPTQEDSNTDSCIMPNEFFLADDAGTPEIDGDNNMIWDPNKWLVYEWDVNCPDADDAATYSPMRMKMEMSNGVLANSTIFIKELTFTQYEGEPEILLERKKSFVTYTIGGEDGSVKKLEADALTYTQNGETVTFAQDANVYSAAGVQVAAAKAGMPVALAKGFYVANAGGKSVKFIVK